MPRLVKGGKYVYGWSTVSENGEVVVPEEAAEEYGISPDEHLVLVPGSRTSGGFGLTCERLLLGTPLEGMSRIRPGPSSSEPCGFKLPPEAMGVFGVAPGARLLVVRGSGRAIGFLARGPIYREAREHPELREW